MPLSDFRYETRQQPKGSKWEDTNIEYTDLNKSLLQNTLNERIRKAKRLSSICRWRCIYLSWT